MLSGMKLGATDVIPESATGSYSSAVSTLGGGTDERGSTSGSAGETQPKIGDKIIGGRRITKKTEKIDTSAAAEICPKRRASVESKPKEVSGSGNIYILSYSIFSLMVVICRYPFYIVAKCISIFKRLVKT